MKILGCAHTQRLCTTASRLQARQWEGETHRVSTCTLETQRGNTFLACAAPFHIWKITDVNKSTFAQSDFFPLASQGVCVFDWLSTVLWRDDSKPQRPGFNWCASRFNPRVCLFAGYLTSQQHASVSQGPICSDKFMCCHTEIAVTDQTINLTQSQYTDTRPTSLSIDPITPGVWQGSHWSANF